MLYLLYQALRGTEAVRFLNILKYPSFRIIAAGVASLVLGMLIGPQLIDRLRFIQHGHSNVREDTPERHQIKRGTPDHIWFRSDRLSRRLAQALEAQFQGARLETEALPPDPVLRRDRVDLLLSLGAGGLWFRSSVPD